MAHLGDFTVIQTRRNTRYKCAYCNTIHPSFPALEHHIKFSEKAASCEKCKVTFGNHNDIQSHLTSVPSHHICYYCVHPEGFPSEERLTQHLDKLHPQCKYCESRLADETEFREHLRGHMPDNKECPDCRLNLPSLSSVLFHLETRKCASRADKARINRLTFQFDRNEKGLTRSDDMSYFYCPSCQNVFSAVSSLFRHAATTPGCDDLLVKRNCLGQLYVYIMLVSPWDEV